ncbi:MAG: DUF695 domain-containing protein [Flavobacteriales bacterium]|nr:DUF695 domain-containing protein [Flavobacteriales bacterium]MBK6943090.1 DUF695 domain-containing protein [Flavobacteriales bacterium]MBK7298850.1 DUF695 domain-containing protein [Flavobacteriales bacterium]MBK9534603.1 DUF695 domain-containing protein [Flavobacteriales bacterium]
MSSFFGFGKRKAPTGTSSDEPKGRIGEYYENELPVIMKFSIRLPDIAVQTHFTFLTVISWKYDGTSNNGMPPREVNNKMIALEDAIETIQSKSSEFVHAYSRTGNNLKELVYYSKGLSEFMPMLNKGLESHEPYPIEINFYEDSDWSELKKLLQDFRE